MGARARVLPRGIRGRVGHVLGLERAQTPLGVSRASGDRARDPRSRVCSGAAAPYLVAGRHRRSLPADRAEQRDAVLQAVVERHAVCPQDARAGHGLFYCRLLHGGLRGLRRGAPRAQGRGDACARVARHRRHHRAARDGWRLRSSRHCGRASGTRTGRGGAQRLDSRVGGRWGLHPGCGRLTGVRVPAGKSAGAGVGDWIAAARGCRSVARRAPVLALFRSTEQEPLPSRRDCDAPSRGTKAVPGAQSQYRSTEHALSRERADGVRYSPGDWLPGKRAPLSRRAARRSQRMALSLRLDETLGSGRCAFRNYPGYAVRAWLSSCDGPRRNRCWRTRLFVRSRHRTSLRPRGPGGGQTRCRFARSSNARGSPVSGIRSGRRAPLQLPRQPTAAPRAAARVAFSRPRDCVGCGDNEHRARATAARFELRAHRGKLVSRLEGEHRWPAGTGPAWRSCAPDDPGWAEYAPSRAELLLAFFRAREDDRALRAGPRHCRLHRAADRGTETPACLNGLWSSFRPTTRRSTFHKSCRKCCHRIHGWKCWWSMITRPTAPGVSPTRWPGRTRACTCCTARGSWGSGRRTSRASSGRWSRGTITSSRWTPISRTIRPTSRSFSRPFRMQTSYWAHATWTAR